MVIGAIGPLASFVNGGQQSVVIRHGRLSVAASAASGLWRAPSLLRGRSDIIRIYRFTWNDSARLYSINPCRQRSNLPLQLFDVEPGFLHGLGLGDAHTIPFVL
jgi:hypothetical protein